ncbi:MAG: SCO1664 family protein, partial [Micromonosporaceae bacterium]
MTDSTLDAPAAEPLDESTALTLLARGELELEGLLAEASNTTLRAVISVDGLQARCIYKPVRGERPLWDFPDGTLAGRELAAYLVSSVGGWGVTPPTVLRDGPLGPGMCQLWLDEAHAQTAEQLVGFVAADAVPEGWLPVAEAEGPGGEPYLLAHADDPRLAAIAVFDVVVNNADRKGGHVLSTASGQVHGVDHGVCFHTDDKLRTVLWGWT